MLARSGIDPALLPPVRRPAEAGGTFRPEAAADLGLPAGLPVAVGGGDAPWPPSAAGIVDPETLLLTFSTGAQVLVPADDAAVGPRGRLHTFCNVLDRARPAAAGTRWARRWSPGWPSAGCATTSSS